MSKQTLTYDTVVIGAGQAGLSTGYFLQQQGRDFVILDGHARVGDVWRRRWDSLRLFTPARYGGLVGMPFPAPRTYFPTKDEMGDYLAAYAAHFQLPIRTGVWVERLTREGDRFVIDAGDLRFEAENVVVAMANLQQPNVPAFAQELDARIVQFHSSAYRNPSQLQPGRVLIVGAGNSGAEIALEVARHHPTWLAGRDVGQLPFRVDSPFSHRVLIPFVLRFLYHRLFSLKTPIGRKVRAKTLRHSGPLIRVKAAELRAVGVERVPRVAGVRDGLPLLDDGRVLDVANVIWCTGFAPGFAWIDLPVQDAQGPVHVRGVVPNVPGLYFVGLHFLSALSSVMIHGVARDAKYIAEQIALRSPVSAPVGAGAAFTPREPHTA